MTDAAMENDRDRVCAFVDLARLGRTDRRTSVKAALKLLAWWIFAFFVVGFGFGFVAGIRHVPFVAKGPIWDMALLTAVPAGLLIGLRGAAVKSQGRPFRSLLGVQFRLNLPRIGLGAGLWLATKLVAFFAMMSLMSLLMPGLFGKMWAAARWHPDTTALVTAFIGLAVIPIQAASEELAFRGWLTQTLGQAIRRTWLLVLVVAALFALAHGLQRGVWGIPVFMLMSIALSGLTFYDRTLDLAIGAHTANNIFMLWYGLISFDWSHERWEGLSPIFATVAARWPGFELAGPLLLLGTALQIGIGYMIVAWSRTIVPLRAPSRVTPPEARPSPGPALAVPSPEADCAERDDGAGGEPARRQLLAEKGAADQRREDDAGLAQRRDRADRAHGVGPDDDAVRQ